MTLPTEELVLDKHGNPVLFALGTADADTEIVSAGIDAVVTFSSLIPGAIYEFGADSTALSHYGTVTVNNTTPDETVGSGTGFYWLMEKPLILRLRDDGGGIVKIKNNSGSVRKISIRRLQ